MIGGWLTGDFGDKIKNKILNTVMNLQINAI